MVTGKQPKSLTSNHCVLSIYHMASSLCFKDSRKIKTFFVNHEKPLAVLTNICNSIKILVNIS